MTTAKIRCNNMHCSQSYTKSLQYHETIAMKIFNIVTKNSHCNNPNLSQLLSIWQHTTTKTVCNVGW
jgi:hypothetical protein